MKTTKTKMVEKYLKENGSITSWEAIQLFGETRLAAKIKNLRKRGWNIETEMIPFTDKFGNSSRYGKYILCGNK